MLWKRVHCSYYAPFLTAHTDANTHSNAYDPKSVRTRMNQRITFTLIIHYVASNVLVFSLRGRGTSTFIIVIIVVKETFSNFVPLLYDSSVNPFPAFKACYTTSTHTSTTETREKSSRKTDNDIKWLQYPNQMCLNFTSWLCWLVIRACLPDPFISLFPSSICTLMLAHLALF